MRRIETVEQKQIMIKLLKYFDEICRDNNINYSLIGGSLIGAIRHHGIIPWDDDVDVILTKENYKKIMTVLENESNSKYKLLNSKTCSNYYLPFPKLIDRETYVVEPQMLKQIDEYGIFIDIFCYIDIPKEEKEKIKIVRKIKLINSLLSRKKIDLKNENLKQNFLRINKNIISKIIGYRKLLKIINSTYNKMEQLNSKYLISNWPIYPIEKEIQLKENTIEYVDVQFENMTAMIFKNYDEILKTTFGNYMELPPKDKRVSHGLEAYWR